MVCLVGDVDFVARGEHYYGYFGEVLIVVDSAEDFETVYLGHSNVQDYKVWFGVGDAVVVGWFSAEVGNGSESARRGLDQCVGQGGFDGPGNEEKVVWLVVDE